MCEVNRGHRIIRNWIIIYGDSGKFHSSYSHRTMINHPCATFLGAFIDAIGGELRSTPIHWATRQGHLSMVVLLIQHGGDPNIHDGEGWNLIPRADGP